MRILRKSFTALRVLREKDGFHRLWTILRYRYRIPLPQSRFSKWKGGIHCEVDYWDHFLAIKGFENRDTYADRLNPDAPLQPRPASLIPEHARKFSILDVGAGPLTYLGKRVSGVDLHITAVDPLADQYEQILEKHGVHPLVKTHQLAAEELASGFPANSFDLVFARNCIDHSYDPEKAILAMIAVARPGGHILLEHTPDEAERQHYYGLHQWNFSMSEAGDFLIRSRRKTVNFTQRHAQLCHTACEVVVDDGEEWLITMIRKL